MKILVAASNMVHIKNFHLPYIEEFKKDSHQAYVMASGEGADFNIPFKKRSFSIKNALLMVKIRKIIKKEKFDIIYLHTTLAAFWMRLALKGLKDRPIVVNTVHGYLFGSGFSALHNKIYLACERLVKGQTDYILTMNNEDEKIAQDNALALCGIYKINGMGIDFSKKEIQASEPKNPPKNLIYVGELSERKNQILLVETLKEQENLSLTLVGDGKERKSIEKYAKKHGLSNRVKVTGFTKNVGAYLKSADLYVSASKIEGLPFNILEAIYARLPIVASNIKGQNDLLPSECLYDLDEPSKLIELIKNPPACSFNTEKYELQNVLSENMEIYYECAKLGKEAAVR